MRNKLWIMSMVLSVVLVMTGCSSGNKIDESGVFVSDDGEFSVVFPGKPEESVEKMETEVGDVETYIFLYQDAENVAYLLSYADYPEKLVTEDSADEMLGGAVEGQLSTLGAGPVVDEKKEITVDGYAGFYTKAYGNGVYSVSKTVLADERLYQMIIMGNGKYVSQEVEDAFIGSLKITK